MGSIPSTAGEDRRSGGRAFNGAIRPYSRSTGVHDVGGRSADAALRAEPRARHPLALRRVIKYRLPGG